MEETNGPKIEPENVTNPNPPPQKIKDPRRVAQGKRLAAANREMKAAREAKKEVVQNEPENGWKKENDGWGFQSACMILSVGIGLGGLYLTWRNRCGGKKESSVVVNDVKKDPPKDEPFDDLFD
ncbi:Hypothetical predicted protein [Paramuricea clavata]|uniref:Uncharacterized protein n=1 Tax=Paramuricea clavata TaxID=317549 RepID=A0A6S7IGU1_PARCT|nr:Hypothetical predicted protein [Paramuricea clavata]